jgi:FMN-dependent NADH-azoreductase
MCPELRDLRKPRKVESELKNWLKLVLVTGVRFVIKPSAPAGRMTSEVIADLKARGSNASMDEGFAHDIEEGIKAAREP